MKVICSKPCDESEICHHSTPHEYTQHCKTGCDNGAKCKPVEETAQPRSGGYMAMEDNATSVVIETKSLTDERGKHYGHPAKHFSCTQGMYNEWLGRRIDAMKGKPLADGMIEDALRHSVYMILDKLSRAANNPMHQDNFDDIQGYARCAKMILGLEK